MQPEGSNLFGKIGYVPLKDDRCTGNGKEEL